MRDPQRIEVVLGMIRKYWNKYPDMRLMQLLQCALGDGDHFHVEDTVLMKKLRETFEFDPDFKI
jgi:uncharacterized protein YihD (DUF1040 family)